MSHDPNCLFLPRMIEVILSPGTLQLKQKAALQPPSVLSVHSRWRSQRAAWKTLCFRPAGRMNQTAGQVRSGCSPAYQRRPRPHFTFWQVSMNSSIVTIPSLFRSIFWKTQRLLSFKESGRGSFVAVGVIPGRISPRVQMGNRLEWWVRCTCPSCHRWTTLSPSFPAGKHRHMQQAAFLL